MTRELNVSHLPTSQALRDCARQWDDLWLRSELSHPTAQAALVAQWLEHFRHETGFRAIVVGQQGRFVAALPLVIRTKGRVVPCMDVPGNEWCSAGQLLIDPHCDSHAVCDVLVDALSELGCSAFWFASVPIEAPWWQSLMAAARRAGWSVDARRRHQVGRLPLQPTWEEQIGVLSAGMRKKALRALRQMESHGKLRLHVARPSRGDRALGLLENGLALEHAGWKGLEGTSVLADLEKLRFIEDQARELIAKEQFAVAMLEWKGRIIAFEYGWCAKQVYHSYKVAYDEEFRRFSPGQLMVYHLLRHFHAGGDVRAVDFLGPLDIAVRRWQPQPYWMGRILMAPPTAIGRAVVFASRFLLTGNTTPAIA